MLKLPASVLVVALASASCGGEDKSPQEKAAIDQVKTYVSTNLGELVAAASALCQAAPAPDADGWSAARDGAAVDAMKASWRKARVAYERVEGAIAVLFPELDVSTDERYDGFVSELGPDSDLFDDEGVTGMHAIERILWADSPRPEVVAFEKALMGYRAAATPANAAEATAFETSLCARLVADTTKMRDQFKPLALDPATAYRGVIGSMEEQLEKVTLAASGEEESRYANETLADMRANVDGGKATHAAFRSWLLASAEGMAVDAKIAAGFARIDAAYAAHPGPQLPPVPASWSSVMPSPADLMTPFGKLFALIEKESDPEEASALVADMEKAAKAMGIPVLPE